jgi:hypothetical protein
MKSIELGDVAGLRITAFPNALIGFIGLWVILSIIAIVLPLLPPPHAILGAFSCTLLHFFSEFWHQLGHSWAARRTGYPMIGVRFWWLLGQSIYPKDEPPLPGKTHIQRALGGPTASFLLTMIAGVLHLISALLIANAPLEETYPSYLVAFFHITLFFFLDNLLVFTLGAFLPLGFTDGSTILRWWGK